MRTLLIDNYDSFTYNLYQLISEVNGVEPVVVRNDEVRELSELELGRFDNIVISPGPGRPDVARDFGISAALIAHAELPLLGVCLGHQGIVLGAGGLVTAAPRARHGFPDRITHDGRDLFADVPQDFTAVRYHSLAAARPLPEALEVTATTSDGVVMGVRHRTRPQWGVQFHPESIASEYGAQLLRNFKSLTTLHAGRRWLRGAVVALRPAESADVPALAAIRATPEVRRWWQTDTDPNPQIEAELADPDSRGWAIEYDGRVAGLIQWYAEEDPEYRHAGIDIYLDPALHGRGIGTDAVRTLSRHLFTEHGHHRLVIDPAADNAAAIGCYRKAGFRPVGRMRQYQRGSDGSWQDGLMMEMLADDMVAEPLAPDTESTLPAIDCTVEQVVIERAVDTEALFLRLYADAPAAFWLDSEHVEPGLDRFSFLGDGSGPLAEMVRYRVGSGAVQVDSVTGTRTVPGGVLDYLSGELRRRRIEFPDVPFDFVGGYVGYLGYEMKADCGARAAHHSPTPDAQWLFADRVIVVDHEAGRTHLLALAESRTATPDSLAAARDWLAATRAIVETLPTWENPPDLALRTDEGVVAPLLTRGRERYLADVAACQDQLHAGESYEICITDSAYLPADSDGLSVYRTLRRCNPAPYAAFLRFEDLEVACSSPERFLKLDRTRTVESKPIKGTAPRGETPGEDDRLAETLALDPKTRAENLMIVDLLRNDLGRVCEIGSVHVPKLMAVETYTTLHQLVSTVRGTLRPGLGVIDALRACFPGGSMTGAPKLRTMEIIDALETEARGIYSGTIGFLGLGGTADLNIVIRTAVRHNGSWRVGAGGAIVLDSDPHDEYQEMLWKAAAALRALPGLAVAPKAPLPSA
ncbi:aminodeoxychorismate synthase component I [Nocardia sp. NPDC056000]|uniref:aminodeoxychorismate synthase component I n=1 Tax=Nocardia sp. NPDC056000 TaxID=3345674 RepID=UPI0035E1FF2D